MKVLLATDGSGSSLKAVQRALEFAQKQDAEVTIISVAYNVKEDFDEMPPNIQDKLDNKAIQAAKEAKAFFDEKGFKAEVIVETGEVPANNILEMAKKGKFDCIVMGSTGLTGLDRVFMGSTAAKVVSYAPCSVYIVR